MISELTTKLDEGTTAITAVTSHTTSPYYAVADASVFGTSYTKKCVWVDPSTLKKSKVPGGFIIFDEKTNNVKKVYIKEIIYNNPATIVFWSDGTKTVSKCMAPDKYNYERGFEACVLKKLYGGSLHKLFDAWRPPFVPSKVTLKDVRKKKQYDE